MDLLNSILDLLGNWLTIDAKFIVENIPQRLVNYLKPLKPYLYGDSDMKKKTCRVLKNLTEKCKTAVSLVLESGLYNGIISIVKNSQKELIMDAVWCITQLHLIHHEHTKRNEMLKRGIKTI